MPKKYRPDPLYPFAVTVKRAGVIIVRERAMAARKDDARVAVLRRHREVPILDDTIEVEVELDA